MVSRDDERARPVEAGDGYRARVDELHRLLGECGDVLVAFSGGVDSGVLLHAARAALGPRAAAVIADSPSLPRRELEEARRLAAQIGAPLEVLATQELGDPLYRANAGDRCYFCKAELFRAMQAYARRAGRRVLAFGEITDDLRDDRPGARAATERGVRAPLREAGLSKQDVRRYAREHGLPVADKPASACLASRIPVGTEVTGARLARVEAAEEAVRALGFRVIRVRDRGARARLEVGGDELARAEQLRERLEAALAERGFDGGLELAAYRSPTGSPDPAGGRA